MLSRARARPTYSKAQGQARGTPPLPGRPRGPADCIQGPSLLSPPWDASSSTARAWPLRRGQRESTQGRHPPSRLPPLPAQGRRQGCDRRKEDACFSYALKSRSCFTAFWALTKIQSSKTLIPTNQLHSHTWTGGHLSMCLCVSWASLPPSPRRQCPPSSLKPGRLPCFPQQRVKEDTMLPTSSVRVGPKPL